MNWLAVASAEHVAQGRQLGIMQVCHGKEAPLRRLKPNDWIVYYSPTRTFKGQDKLQSFTAIGQIAEGSPYQVDMGNGFCPFRRDVVWLPANEVAIASLINQLELTKNKQNWGYQLRFGLLSISQLDMQLIAQSMKTLN
jgi:hypothetical protein